jgi:hypothetical protein
MRLLVTTFRFLHGWTTLPFLRDKEDVFLLPKHEREEVKEVKEVKEEIISRVSKLNGVTRLLYIHLRLVRARGAGNGVRKRKKERKKR